MENEKYMLVALRRRKDQSDKKGMCRRHLVRGEIKDEADDFKKRCDEPGIWRLYRTINRRDLTKASQFLQVELIMNGEDIKDRIADKWKSILMQPKCKAEKYWLVDIDSKSIDLYAGIVDYIQNHETAQILERKETPNGRHLVVTPFDKREFEEKYKDDDVEIKKDALIFMEQFEVE